jgi:hypothetical protein
VGISFYLDLVNTGTNATTWKPAGFYADASLSTETPPTSSTDTAGLTPRCLWVWATVTTGGSTVGTVPTPQATWNAPITSTLMNGSSGPVQALTLLNNPPALRVTQALTTSISNNTATAVPFTAAGTIDTYAGFGTATSTYTAPLNGLYLTFPTVSFASNSTGTRYAGLSVTSGTVTTTLQGPGYAASGAGAMSVTGVRVLDLHAGDTVQATAYQNSGGALNLGGATWNSRLAMLYLCPYSAGGVNSYTPPATAFHWTAGIPASSVAGLLTQHLGNDLNFLVNRPYFTGYQGTAQTGLTVGSWTAVTIDTVGGLIHGSNGDNNAGWSAYNNNYAAPVAGWWLVISEVYAALPSLTTGYLSAGIKVPTSGGITPSTSPDQYQTVYFPLTSGPVPGAAAVGCYWLNAGETVQPVALAQGWSNTTWSTASAAATRSQFTCLWLSELKRSGAPLVWIPFLGSIAANVTPVDTATGSVTGYVLNYGILGIVALAFAFRFVVPRSALENARIEARADLERENARLVEEKVKAEEQRDDALRMAREQLVPVLTTFTGTTAALLPLLQALVGRREGYDRDTGR